MCIVIYSSLFIISIIFNFYLFQGHFEEMEPDYFSYQSDHLVADSFQNLSKSDYAKVIFCDLYYNSDSTVGCRFQITDNVHEDPSDYIGLFRVGYDNLSQCLASKLLSQTDCEDDGKLLRCTFKRKSILINVFPYIRKVAKLFIFHHATQ